MTPDRNFDLRKFLHGKTLLAQLNLFDSRPPEEVTFFYKWDRKREYPQHKIVTHEEGIYVIAVVKHGRLGGFTTLCFSFGCKDIADVDIPYIWNFIPALRIENSWRPQTWIEHYGIHHFEEHMFEHSAMLDFTEFASHYVRKRKLTLRRQMKAGATMVVDLLGGCVLLPLHNVKKEPFDYGYCKVVQSAFRVKRKLDL